MRRFRILVSRPLGAVLAAALFWLSLLSLASADNHAMMLPVHPVPLVVETSAGDRSFTIEVADEEHERSAGLMYRQAMDDDHGMLFVFQQTRPVGFWMRNTPMPLDLVFIGEDGAVRAIEPGIPFSDATITAGVPVRFVLELKSGIAQKTGIAAGDRLRHPVIDAVAGE